MITYKVFPHRSLLLCISWPCIFCCVPLRITQSKYNASSMRQSFKQWKMVITHSSLNLVSFWIFWFSQWPFPWHANFPLYGLTPPSRYLLFFASVLAPSILDVVWSMWVPFLLLHVQNKRELFTLKAFGQIFQHNILLIYVLCVIYKSENQGVKMKGVS